MNEPGIVVTLDEIYKKVQDTDDKVDNLATAVSEMVAINKRLDQHHDRLNDHGSRLGTVETQQAIDAAVQPKKTPWYSIVGGIVGIGTGLLLLIQLVQIGNTLGGN